MRETLEASIPADAPVRVFEFILGQHDGREWEAAYPGGGRPAYPPEAMVGLLIYGYSVGIRSSRALEHACRYSKDFIWRMSGRTPDHNTIASDGSTADGTALPRTAKGMFDKSAFTYDAQADAYTCPTGHRMPQVGTKKRRRKDRTTTRRVYRCAACPACPFQYGVYARCQGPNDQPG